MKQLLMKKLGVSAEEAEEMVANAVHEMSYSDCKIECEKMDKTLNVAVGTVYRLMEQL